MEVRLDIGEGVGGGSVGVDSIMGYGLWFVMCSSVNCDVKESNKQYNMKKPPKP